MLNQTVQEQLIARSLKDSAFRQAVLNDPKKVLANEYNIHLPEHVTVHVLEEAANTFTLVLPTHEEVLRELADTDLEAVAGGLDSLTIAVGGNGNKCSNR